jgi:hypothetical protein
MDAIAYLPNHLALLGVDEKTGAIGPGAINNAHQAAADLAMAAKDATAAYNAATGRSVSSPKGPGAMPLLTGKDNAASTANKAAGTVPKDKPRGGDDAESKKARLRSKWFRGQ